ncbi:N-acetylglutamate synthase, mitochondrial-like isoform X2 [Actinia tenebrosa]|uniref:N-acetylglutamate synthase, mitochondrial-like isoform X2 n=1 Tax=Actinia tenebrosa TaxID=6105 RepID=A0A6P8I418_ACTTE|nr:N-acetylglutamate synthase, mitochondrial-like isoform X2 [Actinia tenebrosa]
MHSCRPARLNNSGERIKVLVNNAKRLVCNDSSIGKTSKGDGIPAGSTQIRQSSCTTQSRGFFTNQPSRDLKRFLEELERLVSCLAFLHRNGMDSVLVHGIAQSAGETKVGILDKQKQQKLIDDNIKLVDMLESNGVKARPFLCSSHMISAKLSSNVNEVGIIEDVDTKHLRWCLSSGHIPVLTAVGETQEGQVVYTDPTHTTIKIASILKPTKVIFLNTSGGLVNENGEVIDCINVPGGLNPVLQQPWMDKSSSNLIMEISQLLLKMPRATSAVITSADSLIKELFTHCGSGTLFQTSEPINTYHSLEGVDVDKLTQLLVRSFDKTLNKDYFLTLKERLHTLYVTESYTAAAILTTPPETCGIPYLDKFTISKESQGLGTSDNLWKQIKNDCPRLCWRSRATNRINPWYFVRSSGSWQNGEWIIFWYGVSDPHITQQIVQYTSSLPSSFDPIAPHDEIKSKKVFSTSSYHKYL